VEAARRLSAASIPPHGTAGGAAAAILAATGGRRTSSAFTGSSADGESLISKFSALSKSAEHETLKLHKEVIEQAKYQLWPLDKKLRVINTAKEYVRRHESELQEKFAQKRSLSTIKQQIQLLFIRFLQVRSNPTQPNQIQPSPAQPNPTQPNPTQPNPTQPNPTQPNLT
jgi:hypothetical protein